MTIDRCICFDQPFAQLKKVAHATGAATLPDLQAHVRFGLKCRLCHPYVQRMLATGETCFHEVLSSSDTAGSAR